MLKNIGPGPLIAAAFIGPGTVTVCTLAGAGFGYGLLWAIALSVVATIVLQEMAARLGIISQQGLAQVIRAQINHPLVKLLAILLILSAIVVGNAAYEAGNISGGVLGLETIFGDQSLDLGLYNLNLWSILIGLVAFVLLYMGNYKVLERVLVFLVILMSLAFLLAAVITKPNLSQLFEGIVKPSVNSQNLLTIIALIGTTVVPYNLFLHASLVKEKWHDKTDLEIAQKDAILAITLGGLVSMCIIISAASIESSEINNASDLAKGLEPLFGNFAKYFLAIGLFAAGITSAITAPLAGAYVIDGCLGWNSSMKAVRFKLVWGSILCVGVLCSSLGIKSIEIIKCAQITNGVLLPVIVGFLLWVMNKTAVLGKYRNTTFQNFFGSAILLITILLAIATLNKVFNLDLL